MAFSVSTLKGVKVYNLTFGKTADQWKEEQRQGHVNSLRYNEAFRRRVEFVQDSVFPVASTKVVVSDDSEWMIATGLYPPKLKVFDLNQLSMKYERGLETEALDLSILTEDHSKFAVLREERWLEFHTVHGKHYNMRLPVAGTGLSYNAPMCELYISTAKNVVLRANLEKGRYFAPFETKIEHISSCDVDKTHLLCAFGGSNGLCEFWDPRSREKVAGLDLYESAPHLVPTPDISKLRFGDDGLSLAVGTSNGRVLVYDLRRQKPLYTLNHRNSIRINDVHWHRGSGTLISSDSKTIRYWKCDSGELYTVITPQQPVNGLAPVGQSGVLFVATEQHRIGAYYVPSIGLAPNWCPFLDSMTEELEEKRQREMYANYKFVSRDELEALGLEHIIGTALLKPYMHGFFMDLRLYRRIRSIVDPNAYASFLKKKTQQTIAAQRQSRISVKSALQPPATDGSDAAAKVLEERGAAPSSGSTVDLKLPSVNSEYAKALIQRSTERQAADGSRDSGEGEMMSAMFDPRFASMFKDTDYEIDLADDYYLKFHPEIGYAMRGTDFAEYKSVIRDIEGSEAVSGKKRRRSEAMEGDSADDDGIDEKDEMKQFLRAEKRRLGQSMLPQLIVDEGADDSVAAIAIKGRRLDRELWAQKLKDESTHYDISRFKEEYADECQLPEPKPSDAPMRTLDEAVSEESHVQKMNDDNVLDFMDDSSE